MVTPIMFNEIANFTPLGQFFVNFTPLGQLFLPILPPWTVYFDNFTPLRHVTPLGHLFLRPPSDKKLQFFTPRSKTRIFSTPLGQGDLTPSDRVIWPPRTKRPFPPSCFLNEIALRLNDQTFTVHSFTYY